MNRWTRWLTPFALALALGIGLSSTSASAQEPAPEGQAGEGEAGRPLDGYLATAALAGLALFVVAKTARR
jgi:hypothetical protein